MPNRDPAEIRTEIERTREEIAQSIVALRDSVTDAADWKTWVRRNPLPFLAGAFAIGLIIGFR